MERHREPREPPIEIDLHGLPPQHALRHLGRELHACRLRRCTEVLVITGRGWGNLQQKPVLRPMVEAWLRGAEGQRLGVIGFEEHSQGGALLVTLRSSSGEPRQH
jgi:DNA-nicking Smr family endonuclease